MEALCAGRLFSTYPEYSQCDFIESFSENDCVIDHLEQMFRVISQYFGMLNRNMSSMNFAFTIKLMQRVSVVNPTTRKRDGFK